MRMKKHPRLLVCCVAAGIAAMITIASSCAPIPIDSSVPSMDKDYAAPPISVSPC